MRFPVEYARALLEPLIPADGSTPARKVHEAAERAGVPEWAMRKARKSLELEVRFVGFGGDGWWAPVMGQIDLGAQPVDNLRQVSILGRPMKAPG